MSPRLRIGGYDVHHTKREKNNQAADGWLESSQTALSPLQFSH